MAERDTILTELRLAGQRQYESGMQRAAAATDELDDSVERLGDTAVVSNKRLLSFGDSADKASRRGLRLLGTRAAAGGYGIAAIAAATAAAMPGVLQLAGAAAAGASAFGAMGIVTGAAVDRFSETSGVAGMAANNLLTVWNGFVGQLRKTTAPAADILLSGLTNSLLTLGDALKPLEGPLQVVAGAMADVARAMAGSFADMAPRVGQLFEDLAPAIGKLPSVMTPLMGAFVNLAEAGVEPLGRLLDIGADLAEAFEGLTADPSKYRDIITPFMDMAPFFTNILFPVISGIGSAFWDAFKITAKALGAIGKLAEPLKPVFEAIGYAIGFAFGTGKFVGAIKVFDRLGAVVIKVLGKLGGFGRAVYSLFVHRLIPIVDKFWGAFTRLAGPAMRGVVGFVVGIKDAFRGMFNWLKTAWIDTINWIIDRLNSAVGALNTVIGAANKLPGVDIGEIGRIGRITRPGRTSGFENLPAYPTPRALGGPVMPRMPYVVGERGPELFVPKMPGSIYPDAGGMAGLINLTAITQLDGKVLARTTARVTSEQMARR